MVKRLDEETKDRLVDVLLEYNRTPRHQLFEYPYNERESNEILEKAERAVHRIVRILNEKQG